MMMNFQKASPSCVESIMRCFWKVTVYDVVEDQWIQKFRMTRAASDELLWGSDIIMAEHKHVKHNNKHIFC